MNFTTEIGMEDMKNVYSTAHTTDYKIRKQNFYRAFTKH